MRFAHIADTHLGIRQYNLDEREEDFYQAFHESVDKIIESECDFVVHSGDLFDEPRPQVKAMVEARDAIDRLLEAGILVFAIAGNHDILMRKGALPPHAIYKKIEMLTPKKPTREFEGMLICGLPYHSKMHASALRDKLKELEKEAKNYDNSILLLHQGVDKYFGLEYELKIGDIPGGFDYYALGHIHKRIEDDFGGGKLVYPGSTEMWRMDELGDFEKSGKGFVIVDTSNFDVKRMNLEGTRKFLNVEIGAPSDFDFEKIEREIGDSRPVVNVKINPDLEYNDVLGRIKELEGEVLRLAIKKGVVKKEHDEFSSKTVNISEIMEEVMKDYTPEERRFAVYLFDFLKERKIDEAQNISEEFFGSWGRQGEKAKSAKSRGKEKPQDSQSLLEAFR
jgi:DNA repair exonuclease SbcCD nuclease subunit